MAHSLARPLGWDGHEPLPNAVHEVGRDRVVCHFRLPHARGDRAHADWDLLQRKLRREHLREMGGCGLRAVVRELREGRRSFSLRLRYGMYERDVVKFENVRGSGRV